MGFHSRGAQLGWLPVGKKIIIYAQKKNIDVVGSRVSNPESERRIFIEPLYNIGITVQIHYILVPHYKIL